MLTKNRTRAEAEELERVRHKFYVEWRTTKLDKAVQEANKRLTPSMRERYWRLVEQKFGRRFSEDAQEMWRCQRNDSKN